MTCAVQLFFCWTLLLSSRWLAEGYDFQSKQIGHNGDSLIIGSKSFITPTLKDVLPSISDKVLQCTKLPNNAFKKAYKTKVYKRSTRRFQVSEVESIQTVELSEYFVQVTADVWSCKPKKVDNGKENFLKVVNELISIKDIYDIKHYDEVRLYLKKFDDVDRVKVEEIKCLAENENGVLTQFKCQNDWDIVTPTDRSIPNLVEQILVSKPVLVDTYYQDEQVAEMSRTISSQGRTLKIGSSPPPSGKPAKKYLCQPPSFVNVELFLPKCYQRIDNRGSNKFYAEIPLNEFGKLFVIVDREVQICHCETDVIYRVKHTVIGKTNVKEIEYGHDIAELYSIRLPDSGTSIRYIEIRHFDANTRNPVDHDVLYKTSDEKHVVSTVRLNNTEVHDIFYRLAPTSIFRTLISSDGYNIRVGSKPVPDTILKASDVKCKRMHGSEDFLKFGPVFTLEIVEDGVLHTLVSDDTIIVRNYFDQALWSCESEKDKNVKFLRVSTLLDIVVPVHTIDSYDGVEILAWPSSNGQMQVRIFEVKYLLNGNAVRFEGSMNFEQSDVVNTLSSVGQLSSAIKKYEIYPAFASQVATRKHNSKDYKWDDNEYKRFLVEADNGDAIMNFSVNGGHSQLEANQPFLIICKLNETMMSLLPQFKILNKNLALIEEMDTSENMEFNSKYFESVVSEGWVCQASSQEDEKMQKNKELPQNIYRFITKQNLKRPTPNNIGEIYHTALDKIWFEMMDNEYKLKIKGIRYYEGVSQKIYNHDAYVIFEDEPRNGTLESGTKALDNYSGKSKRTLYVTKEEENYYQSNTIRMYRLTITKESKDGVQLIIGSKWTRMYGNYLSNLTCEEMELAMVNGSTTADPLFFTQVFVKGQENSRNVFSTYFSHFKLRIWSCTDVKIGGTILRVMNNFKFIESNITKIKQLFYQDGVIVISGQLPNGNEQFEFTEYKYLDPINKGVIKFEGNLILTLTNGASEIKSTLKHLAVRDTNHILNEAENEVYRTKLQEVGSTLEIGKIHNPPSDAYGIIKYCTILRYKHVVDDDLKKFMLPRVVMTVLNTPEHNSRFPVTMGSEDLEKFFDYSQEIFLCMESLNGDPDTRASERLYYRVVNRMKVRSDHPVSQIYHSDGVRVHKNGDKFEIEDIKFVLRTKVQQSNGKKGKQYTYEEVKFESYVSLSSEEFVKNFRSGTEVEYFLDTEILRYDNLLGEGPTIEVESHYDRMIEIDNNDLVTCIKMEDTAYPSKHALYNTKIFMDAPVNAEKLKWQEKDSRGQFQTITQEIWNCQKDEVWMFHRIVNKLITLDTETRIYHNSQTVVGSLFLPNGEKALQVTHQKFVCENETIKYVGVLQFVVETMSGAEKFLKSFHYDKSSSKILPEPERNHIWLLDSFRVLPYRDRTSETKSIPGVTFLDEKRLYTKLVDARADRMFQLGRFWNQKLVPSKAEPIECTRFTWDPAFIPEYTPRVAEYIDGSLYTNNEDMFNEAFKIIECKVWLCTNKFDEFLRVRTVYQSKISIFAVRYTDGVEVKTLSQKEGDSRPRIVLEVAETVYMDTLASNVFRYDGDLKGKTIPAHRKAASSNGKIPPVAQESTGLGRTMKRKFGKFWRALAKSVNPPCCRK